MNKQQEMTQQQIDEKYPLWKCEERPYHEHRIDRYGYSASIYEVWNGIYGKSEKYLFLADADKAGEICKRYNQSSRDWKPKFNTIGALIN